jgi:hypothetical protein
VLFPFAAWSVDCPVDPNTGSSYPDWPTTRTPQSPNNITRVAHSTCNGSATYASGSAADVSLSGLDLGAAIAATEGDMQAAYSGTQTFTTSYHSTGSNYVQWCVKANSPSRSVMLKVWSTATTCTPVTPPSGFCAENAGKWVEYDIVADSPEIAALSIEGECVGIDACVMQNAVAWSPAIDLPGGPDVLSYPVRAQITGESCATPVETVAESTPTDDAVGDDEESCRTSKNGSEYCYSDQYGENCGYFNDKFVCLGKTDQDECWVNDDGSRYCAEGAPSPPRPDNGTRGSAATPDDSIQGTGKEGEQHAYDYYDATTSAGSSDGGSESGANPGRDDSTNPGTEATPVAEQGSGGGGGGDGTADDSVSGGGSCDSAPVCSGNPIECAILSQQWKARCPDSLTTEELEEFLGPFDDGEGNVVPTETFTLGTLESYASGWMGAEACLEDLDIELPGSLPTVTIPLSEWCWLLGIIGIFVMISSYISAARIVVGGL